MMRRRMVRMMKSPVLVLVFSTTSLLRILLAQARQPATPGIEILVK